MQSYVLQFLHWRNWDDSGIVLVSYRIGGESLWCSHGFLVGSYGIAIGSYGSPVGFLDRPAMKDYKSFLVGLSCPPLSLLSCPAFCSRCILRVSCHRQAGVCTLVWTPCRCTPLLPHDPACDHSRSLHLSIITPAYVYTPGLA